MLKLVNDGVEMFAGIDIREPLSQACSFLLNFVTCMGFMCLPITAKMDSNSSVSSLASKRYCRSSAPSAMNTFVYSSRFISRRKACSSDSVLEDSVAPPESYTEKLFTQTVININGHHSC